MMRQKRLSAEDLEYILIQTQNLWTLFKSKHIFITGGTGFFGKWILETLIYVNEKLQLNLSISVLSRNPSNFLSLYPFYTEYKFIEFIKGDVRDFDFPQTKNYHFIIHAATDADAVQIIQDPLLISDTIIWGTRKMLEFAKQQNNLQGFLLTSSGAVYGKQPDNISGFTESFLGAPDPLLVSSSYSEAKRMAECLCSAYFNKYNLPVKIARCFAFVGPYLPLNKHFAIGNFIHNGLDSKEIVITGNGSPLRSYMYAADMVICLISLLLRGKNGEAYNVGSDEAVSIKDVALTVAQFFPGIEINVLNQTRSTDRNQNYIPDISKIKKEINLNPILSLKESIKKTIAFYE